MALKMQTNALKFASWEPDRSNFGSHIQEAKGVIPALDGYLPLPSPAWDTRDALPEAFNGAGTFVDSAGSPLVLVGTKTSIYYLRSDGWTQVGSGYNESETGWDFAKYGDMIIAVNGVDVPQYATESGGTVTQFQAITGAPVASSVEVVKEFVVLGGVGRTKVRWSAVGNPLDWPTPGTNDAQYTQSDEQDFPDTGSTTQLVGSIPGVDVLIFTERAVYRGEYIGTPYVFQFDTLDKVRGTMAPRSVVSYAGRVYFFGEEGLFAIEGTSIANIGAERINRWFRNTVIQNRRHEVRAQVDMVRGIIMWTFPGTGSVNYRHNYILLYNPALERFSYAVISGMTGIIQTVSFGKTLEDLDAIADLDHLPFSLDSQFWMGGVPGLAVFDSQNRLCPFGGDLMEAVIDTAEAGGKRHMIHGIRPLVGGMATASVLHRDLPYDDVTLTPCADPSDFDGICYCHISTRYAAARVTIPKGTDWKYASGLDMFTEAEG
jgi:hypothetical protein